MLEVQSIANAKSKILTVLAVMPVGTQIEQRTHIVYTWYNYTDSQSTCTEAFLWPPCIADADTIFLPCGFFLFFLA